jgi:hypothetical protein
MVSFAVDQSHASAARKSALALLMKKVWYLGKIATVSKESSVWVWMGLVSRGPPYWRD